MDRKERVTRLRLTAARCRKNILRMVRAGGHGHVGGALSAMDVVSALYFDKMRIDPENPKDPDRDRFLLSAGHKCLCQYAALAERGFFEKEILDTYGKLGSHIPGHPDMHKLAGVEANTGALGHGISIACGMAAAAKLDGRDYRVYAVTGDGELPEGSNWEAAAAAAKFGLDNLTVFVDNNGLQISGRVEDVMNMEPIDDKFRSFGWAVRVIDGNNMEEILETLDALPFEAGKPNCVVMKTVKARGLPFGEGKAAFHFWDATEELLQEGEASLDAEIAALEKEAEVGA
ncbi:MAG: transketolase [Lachnospiraceae bacterium]|nr:transketolase [Lachnospiraceae bacterium]